MENNLQSSLKIQDHNEADENVRIKWRPKYSNKYGDEFTGEFYENEIKNGKYIFNDTSYYVYYTGGFKDGDVYGGKLVAPSGYHMYPKCLGTDEERMVIDFVWPNGDSYSGNFNEDSYRIKENKNKISGSGTYKFSNGDSFKGSFQGGNMSFGTYNFKNGDCYNGYFVNNKRHDKNGVYKFDEGTSIEGNFAEDLFV